MVAGRPRTGLWAGGPTPRLNGIDLGDGRPLWSEPLNARVSVGRGPTACWCSGAAGSCSCATRVPVRWSAPPRRSATASRRSRRSPSAGRRCCGTSAPRGTGVAALDPETLAVRWRQGAPGRRGRLRALRPVRLRERLRRRRRPGPAHRRDRVAGRGHPLRRRLRAPTAGHGLGAGRHRPGAHGRAGHRRAGRRPARLAYRRGAGGGPPVLSRTLPGDSRTVLAFLGPPTGCCGRWASCPRWCWGASVPWRRSSAARRTGNCGSGGSTGLELAFTRA